MEFGDHGQTEIKNQGNDGGLERRQQPGSQIKVRTNRSQQKTLRQSQTTN